MGIDENVLHDITADKDVNAADAMMYPRIVITPTATATLVPMARVM
jgi:hypothetical protein